MRAALTTITWSPESIWVAKVGLWLPSRTRGMGGAGRARARRDPARGRLPAPDAEEGGHDAPDHLAQEGVADHVDRDRPASSADPGPVEGPGRVPIRPPRGTGGR